MSREKDRKVRAFQRIREQQICLRRKARGKRAVALSNRAVALPQRPAAQHQQSCTDHGENRSANPALMRLPPEFALFDFGPGMAVYVRQQGKPCALIGALVHPVLAWLETPIFDRERHALRGAERFGKGVARIGRPLDLVVGQSVDDERYDFAARRILEEGSDFRVDKSTAAGVRRTDDDDLGGGLAAANS